MKKTLPQFALVAALAAGGATCAQSLPNTAAAPAPAPLGSQPLPAAERVSPSDELLVKATDQLTRRASIRARLQYEVFVSGQELKGFGNYWQQGSGEDLKVRLELTVAQETRLTQVCNGRFVWVDRRLPSGRTVTCVDLRKIRADPAFAPSESAFPEPGQASWTGLQSLISTHSGGLPNLLASLRENFVFMPPQAMQLEMQQPGAAAPLKIPVYAVVGQWKPERLAAMLAKNEEAQADPQSQKKAKKQKPIPIPDRLPQEVLLLVGQSDFFPYRIEYRRLETPNDGQPVQYQISAHPLVVLNLADVVFDSPVAAGQFDYSPGDVDFIDQTPSILEKLRQARQAQLASRPANSSATPTR